MNDARREELAEKLSRLLGNHQSDRRDLKGALFTIQKVLSDMDRYQLELQELHRELDGRFHPGIRISDTEVILPGDKVLIEYHSSQREGIVTETRVYDSTPFSPGPMEPSIIIYEDGSTSYFGKNEFHQLSLIEPERHTPLPDPRVFEVSGTPVVVGDRVESKELGPGTVRYLVELPELGLYVQFDKDVGERTPTFLPHKELEFLCLEGEEEELEEFNPILDPPPETPDPSTLYIVYNRKKIYDGSVVHRYSCYEDGPVQVGRVRFERVTDTEDGMRMTFDPEGGGPFYRTRYESYIEWESGERTPLTPYSADDFHFEDPPEEKEDSKPPETPGDDDTQTDDSTETSTDPDPLFSAVINGVRVREGYLCKDNKTGRRVGEIRFVPEYRGSQPGYGVRLKIDGYRKLYPATFSDLDRYSFYPNPESLVMIGEGHLAGIGDHVEVEAEGVPLGTRGKIVEINRDSGKVSVEVRDESSGKLKPVSRYDVHPRYLLPLKEAESGEQVTGFKPEG